MRIAVLGGGPGGLFAATLVKTRDPRRGVVLFERNRAEDTFGFGVVFSDATLDGIHAADPVLRTALTEHGVHWDPIEVRLHGERFSCHEFDVDQPPGKSDEKTRAYLQELFAEQIDGAPLLVNNSRWGNFRTRRASRWRHRVGGTAIALLGDAAHTAHFSVGSGTKMAMEDAVALAAALGGHPDDVDAALVAYEKTRQPQVARIQDSARPSLSWWEHFGRSYDTLPPWQFAYHFFTRSLPESKLRRRDDGFVEDVHALWRVEHHAEPLASRSRWGWAA
jgi:2-polyprenyl-6-methoxyphenol hydroxylase-like FAD-dependent oxidoreductase